MIATALKNEISYKMTGAAYSMCQVFFAAILVCSWNAKGTQLLTLGNACETCHGNEEYMNVIMKYVCW